MQPSQSISQAGVLKRPTRLFYGCWIVAAGFLLDALKQGTFNLGFSTYFLPIQRELHLSRTSTSFAFTLGRLEGGVQGPLIGYLIDRWGPRLMVVVGAVFAGVGLILLSFTHRYELFLLVFVGLLSVGFRSGFDHSSMAAVNRWFYRRKALAISVVTMGHGLGGALIVPLIGIAVFRLGWRAAALCSGIAVLAIGLPLALLVRNSPEESGLLPDGEALPLPPLQSPPYRLVRSTPAIDFTIRQALHTRAFWQFVRAAGCRATFSLTAGARTPTFATRRRVASTR
jgi:sugar phosphate permease